MVLMGDASIATAVVFVYSSAYMPLIYHVFLLDSRQVRFIHCVFCYLSLISKGGGFKDPAR